MSCYICSEKAERHCKFCSQWVCKYDSSYRIQSYTKEIVCNVCSLNSYKIDNFLELQSVYKANCEKLQDLESLSSNIGLEINNLLDLEISLSNKFESITNSATDSIEMIKSKLLLEETSKNNALQSATSIYKAIENQTARIEALSTKSKVLEQEKKFLQMLNSHKTREISKISANLKNLQRSQASSIDLSSVQNAICSNCQIKLFGTVSNISVLFTEKEQIKACSSCRIS